MELVRELLAHAKLPAKPRVLDVGCGVGGTSIFLAREVGARVTGVTISTKQVQMARAAAEAAGVDELVDFHEGDGERLDEMPVLADAAGTFDAVWISEALSHFVHKDKFFAHAHTFLKPGGKLVLADWFRADHISKKHETGVIAAIEAGMLLPRLDAMPDYLAGISKAGMRLLWLLDVSKETAKTWDISLELVANPVLWQMCMSMGSDFIAFLRAFTSMREGFASGAFRYGLMVRCVLSSPCNCRRRRRSRCLARRRCARRSRCAGRACFSHPHNAPSIPSILFAQREAAHERNCRVTRPLPCLSHLHRWPP